MDFSDWKEEMHMEQVSGQLNNNLCTIGPLIFTFKSTPNKSEHSDLVCSPISNQPTLLFFCKPS